MRAVPFMVRWSRQSLLYEFLLHHKLSECEQYFANLEIAAPKYRVVQPEHKTHHMI